MNAQAKPNEPSMEEILASIRRIIADDEVKPAESEAPAPAPVAPPEPEAADDDILDLASEADLVAPAASPATPAPRPAPESPAAVVAEDIGADDAGDLDFREMEPEPAVAVRDIPPVPPQPAAIPFQPAASAPGPTPGPAAVDMAQLLSDQTSSAVQSAFGQLANTVLSSNARTLEDLVKDMLKPMLKSWLDDNLPVMVERLVRAEIERVARGGRS